MSAIDIELARIDQEWARLHRDAFGDPRRRTWMQFTYTVTTLQRMVTQERLVAYTPNRHGQWRPAEQWWADVEELVEVREIRTFRLYRGSQRPARREPVRGHRAAA